MTQRAQELLDRTMKLSLRPQKGDRQKLISFILREIVDQLQYYNVHPGEDMIIDSRSVYDLADEVEAL